MPRRRLTEAQKIAATDQIHAIVREVVDFLIDEIRSYEKFDQQASSRNWIKIGNVVQMVAEIVQEQVGGDMPRLTATEALVAELARQLVELKKKTGA